MDMLDDQGDSQSHVQYDFNKQEENEYEGIPEDSG